MQIHVCGLINGVTLQRETGNKMDSICHKLHQLAGNLPRLKFPFDEKAIPLNGIYILFEAGETAHGTDRIVRIGSHTGDNQLRSRLKQHFLLENKDRSIFRKNIGRCLLNKSGDPFLTQWDWDLTTKQAKVTYGKHIDFDKLKQIEHAVTRYMQANFSFVAFRVDSKGKRLGFESKITSTVSLCNECSPSKNWLGLYSPKEKIRQSGLWQVNELYKEPLSNNDWEELIYYLDS